MGLNQSQEKGRYLQIQFGAVCETVTEGTAGAEERENKNGKKVFEKRYDSISGRIVTFQVQESKEFGDKLVIGIDDVGEKFYVQMPIKSRYFGAFVSRMRNMKPQTVYCLKPYDFEPRDGGRKVGMNIYEGTNDKGIKVETYFTKENNAETGMPEFPTGGDKSDVEVWGIQVTKFMKKEFEKQAQRWQQGSSSEPQKTDEDDLPF